MSVQWSGAAFLKAPLHDRRFLFVFFRRPLSRGLSHTKSRRKTRKPSFVSAARHAPRALELKKEKGEWGGRRRTTSNPPVNLPFGVFTGGFPLFHTLLYCRSVGYSVDMPKSHTEVLQPLNIEDEGVPRIS